MSPLQEFIAARDALLAARGDLAAACRGFKRPTATHFNWVADYFEPIANGNTQAALRVVDDAGRDVEYSYDALRLRCNQVANFLAAQGVGQGDRVLVMLGNVVPLWETMLAVIKLGAVMIPATTLLDGADLEDRIERGRVKAVITHSNLADRFTQLGAAAVRIVVGAEVPGWLNYDATFSAATQINAASTRADDLLLLYFTSGTTAKPKLVAHTHTSYPIGHLSTMYWLGLQPDDVHLNLSSPGWAKHAWSCFFSPWNAQATVLAYQYDRFDARALLDVIERCGVTVFCAPPTVWRMLIQQDLKNWRPALREAVSAGEPLNPEVIAAVRNAWGVTIRDGFGQTETTAQIGNPPGLPLTPGSMGLPLPGYRIELIDADGKSGDEGEICIDLSDRAVGLMQGYLDDAERTDAVMRDGYYHTGDVASRDSAGYLTYVGRMDDVFKSSDYRISPFELESVLIEHPAVAEAAVVPSPDPTRLSVPKAFVVLSATATADADTARSIFEHVRARVSPYKRIRRLQFAALPKTISGKIRRGELRTLEQALRASGERAEQEFWEQDFGPQRS
ncbi:AMP-binding protein [Steroidobacter sp.]|uniref:AMP-binding protein n=1 Tax=Steroidobacter sp. TaxID=1978227 RepID=UPI001A3F3939|nr:AMP-binding protein [Steroidobacter sp.]MBL8271698.1 AMP-binding protein [Steroidobacter sp.]